MAKEMNSIYTKKYVPEGMQQEYPVSVCFTDFSFTTENTHWHWHDEIELLIVNSGSLRVQTETDLLDLSAGQGIIINQNTVHAFQSISPKACTCYTIAFSPRFFLEPSQLSMTAKFLHPVLSSFHILLLDESNAWDEEVLNIVDDIIAINMTKKSGFELVTKGYLCQLWFKLYERISDTQFSEKPAVTLSVDNERIKSAITYIEENYADNVTLDEIAASVHVSKSECCRFFKRTLKMTPFEYLMKYRIYVASQLMIESTEKISISSLALSVGFNNASYFNKVFKKYMNCTPKEYIASVQKGK